MKKTPLLLALFLVVLCLYSNAQPIRAYVSSGGIVSQIEGDELKGFSHFGFIGGVGASMELNRRGSVVLAVETNFAQRGVFNRSGDPYNIDMTLNYVDIPVSVYYHDLRGGMYVGGGLAYGRLVGQPSGVIKYNPNYFIPDTTNMDFLRNDISIHLEFKFVIWKALLMSFRYQASIMPIKKNWAFEGYHDVMSNVRTTEYNDCYNQSVSVRLSWVFGSNEGDRMRRKTRR